jgi:recombination protein RecT
MSTELVAVERQLTALAPRFEMVLDKRVPVQRLLQTVIVSCENTPKLLQCNRQSLFNSAMSAAVLGLEVDGVTGQAYLIPFKERAQLVIGYKGYNTMAARSGLTVTGEVVREGDAFDYDLGEGWVKHRPAGDPGARRIIYAWSKAAHNSRPAIVKVLTADELLAVKERSPGARKPDSPWNDTRIGFPAMCEKTAKRRLARSLPLNVIQYAARMEEAFEEQGLPSWISPDKGVVIDGQFEPAQHPSAQELIGPAGSHGPADAAASSKSSPHAEQGDAADDVTSEELAQYDQPLAEAATHGMLRLQHQWGAIPPKIQRVLKSALDNRYKPIAEQVDLQASAG